ncbi:MAG: hypothetical protein WDO13_10270 [Verrucomicrobiota bacterium]
MKWTALFLALTVLPVAAEDWTTNDGVTYQDVRVLRVEDDAITIIYKDGGALVPLFKLSPELQKKFDYDPVKAKVAAEARAKEDVQNAKALQAEIDAANQKKLKDQIRDAKSAQGPTAAAH